MPVLTCAHRGASGYAPENTMSAWKLAYEMKADAIENDVHLTSDGELVVIHDDVVNRTSNGSGTVSKMTLAQLKALDFGAKFHKRFQGERISTLDEQLEFIKKTGMLLNIELKTDEKQYDIELPRKVAQAIVRLGLENKIIISSFYHKSLIDFKGFNKNVPTAILHSNPITETGAYASSIGALYSHPVFTIVDEVMVAECALHGVKVNPWTVNTPQDMARMKSIGVNMIITNYPDICAKI